MPRYELECRGESRCIYEVEARDEAEAREKWESGQLDDAQPYYEIEGEEIVRVRVAN